MELELQVISAEKHLLGANAIKRFQHVGGVIGRSDLCDWYIPDQKRHLSGQHALITYESGAFFLTDISTNGVVLNHAAECVAKEVPIPLSHDDHILMGDFEMRVLLHTDTARSPYSSGSLQASSGVFEGISDQQLGSSQSSSLDPLAVFQTRQSNSQHFGFNHAPHIASSATVQEPGLRDDHRYSASDHRSGVESEFQLPNMLPEDWNSELADGLDETCAIPFDEAEVQHGQNPYSESAGMLQDEPLGLFDSPLQAPAAAPSHAPPHVPSNTSTPMPAPGGRRATSQAQVKPVATELPKTKAATEVSAHSFASEELKVQRSQPVSTSTPAMGIESTLEAFSRGLGVSPESFSGVDINTLMERVGACMAVNMKGMISIMQQRAQLKNEFRMDMTFVKREDNNPLKFSADQGQALKHLVRHEPGAFLEMSEAFEECYGDLMAHQVGVMAGVQSALDKLLNKLDPYRLEKKFEDSKAKGISLSGKRSRYWEAYKELHGDIMSEDDVFSAVFGDSFAKAYGKQVQALKLRRKKEVSDRPTDAIGNPEAHLNTSEPSTKQPSTKQPGPQKHRPNDHLSDTHLPDIHRGQIQDA